MNIALLWIWFKAHFWAMMKVFYAFLILLFALRGLLGMGLCMVVGAISYRFWWLQ